MPDVQGALVAPWGAGQQVAGGTVVPWGRAGRVQAFGTAYTPPAPPPGSDTFTPNDLTAPLALGPASSYHQAHTLAVTDLRTSTALRVDSLRLSLDDGAAFWTLAAEGPLELFDVLTGGEQPALVQVQVDGHTWAFVVETVARPRSSRPTRVTFGGRSVAAVADAPYQFALTYSAEAPTTAAQLCAGALLAAGVALDWKLADWPIPAGAVSIQGTPMDVVRAVAGAVGAVVTAHPSDYRITVQSRYDLLPNEWAYAPPDVQLHSSAVESETFDRADKPAYTGVFVAGQQGGALGYVRLEGTSGGDQAPMVTDALLTDVEALRERARAVLGAGGKQARVTRVLPVCTGAGQPGVLERGALVRCIDAAANGVAGQSIWHGVVRSVGLAVQPPVVQQTLGFERHTGHVVDAVTAEPLVLNNIPDQSGAVGELFTLDLTQFREGGKGPFVWSLRSGVLPAGLLISGETIVGTLPTVPEVATLRVRVVDAVSQMRDSAEFAIAVTAGGLTIASYEPTAADMAGMTVSVIFEDEFTSAYLEETLTWAATGPTSGGVTSGNGWSLSCAGDTFGAVWQFVINGTAGLGALKTMILNGGPALVAFDRAAPNPGSTGSAAGRDFAIVSYAFGSLGFSTQYLDPVTLADNAEPVGDLYYRVRVDFNLYEEPYANWSFVLDTDKLVES